MRDAALNDAALKEKKLALETLKKRSAEVWQVYWYILCVFFNCFSNKITSSER